MEATSTSAPDIRFEFNCFKFNGKGEPPTTVPSVNDAHFMRSRQSIEGALIDMAKQRVEEWCKQHGLNAYMRKPYPSNAAGKYWVEFRFGGLTL